MRVYELRRDRFAVALQPLSGIWYDRAQIDSVLGGRQPGRVFVDDPQRPAAVLVTRSFGFYLGGDAGSLPIRAFVADAPAESGVFDSLYGYMVDRPWMDALQVDANPAWEVIERRPFSFPAGARVPEPPAPAGSTIVPIDAELAERIDAEMRQLIRTFWGGYDLFQQGGFGYCTMLGTEIASVAYAISVSAQEANIGVQTAEPFRRRGLSTVTGAAYIRHCRRHGLTATWDADATNIASLASARALGFVEHAPFWQLSPARGVAKVRSRGRWNEERARDGVTAWVSGA